MAGKLKDGEGMALTESIENYLKAILIIKEKYGEVRRVDLAHYMGYSKASISNAVKTLRNQDCILLVGDRIELNERGEKISKEILERHMFFTQLLVNCGVEYEKALQEACGMEHAISEESFRRIKKTFKTMGAI